MPPLKLSLTLIVKNEQHHLATVLKNAKIFADEIVIVDTGSTDQTKSIAAQFTNKIFDFKWVDDFATARNFGIEQCSGDYIMWLDADDEIPDEDAHKFKSLKQNLGDFEIYYLPYFCWKDDQGKPAMRTVRERIFCNKPHLRFSYPIHEAIFYPAKTKVKMLNDICIYHNKQFFEENYMERNLKICEKAVSGATYSKDSRMWWVYGRELSVHRQYEQAIEALKNSILYARTNSTAFNAYIYQAIGEAYLNLGNAKEAIFHFKIAKSIVSDWREPLFKLYEIYQSRLEFKNAQKCLTEILKLPTVSNHEIPNPQIYDNNYIQELIESVNPRQS